MAEHRDANRAIAYGDRTVENGSILMQRFSDMVRSVRGRLVFSPFSLLWGTRERLCLSSVIHEHTNHTHTLVGVGLFKVCVVCPLVTARGVPGEGFESLPW